MRILADENLPKSIVEMLRNEGHDVLWARTDSPGSGDLNLLELAESQGRIVLTLDKDFWHIAMQRRAPLAAAGIVLFRVHPATVTRLLPLIRALISTGRDWRGHISTVSDVGIQMVPLSRRREEPAKLQPED
jgi:predicted nuclease of predicted toxin-antitoxin system